MRSAILGQSAAAPLPALPAGTIRVNHACRRTSAPGSGSPPGLLQCEARWCARCRRPGHGTQLHRFRGMMESCRSAVLFRCPMTQAISNSTHLYRLATTVPKLAALPLHGEAAGIADLDPGRSAGRTDRYRLPAWRRCPRGPSRHAWANTISPSSQFLCQTGREAD
jgi:hypothetical protein